MELIDTSSDGPEREAACKVASQLEATVTLEEINQKIDLLIDLQRETLRERTNA